MEYVLTAENLVKHYGTFKALNGLSLHVPKGSVYGLVGRNGAGKTTLIRLFCGLQAPTAGSYTLYSMDGQSREAATMRRRIGAVVETPSIYLDLSAADNLREQNRVLGVPSDGNIPELLRLVGLENTRKKKAGNFSLGMKQRLGIAVALAGDPDLLILDEPVNGLDPQGIVEMRELLLRLNRERRITVLISSHILDELARLATHYGFIDAGRMVKEMSAEEVDASCRKCLRLEVSDVRALARVLTEWDVGFKILSERAADVYAQPNISQLASALGAEGCELISAHERDESLESFFLSLVGGGERE